MNQRLAVVIVNYGSHRLIADNLTTTLNAASVDVVIVDNFSNAAELSALQELAAANGWNVVTNPNNDGFGAGMNAGVARAKELGSDAYLLLNPDVHITAETITALHEQVRDQPLTVACPAIVDANGKPWFLGGELNPITGAVRTSQSADVSNQYGWLTGACLAISPTAWEASGGFNPTYFLYWEDVDFSQRCRAAGVELVVRRDLEVIHDVGGTQGEGKSALYIYYNCRNRLIFSSLWLPAKTQRSWVAKTPVQSYRILRRAGSRRAMLRWEMILATTRGSFAGVRAVLRQRSSRNQHQ